MVASRAAIAGIPAKICEDRQGDGSDAWRRGEEAETRFNRRSFENTLPRKSVVKTDIVVKEDIA